MRTRHLFQAIALASLLATSAANAQSSYVMTTLSTPASSQGFVATAMDNAGKVVGFQQMRNGTLYASPGDFGMLASCLFGCAAYTAQPVFWAAGTGSSVAATLGDPYYAPTHVNDRGNMVGFVVQLKAQKVTVLPPVTPGLPSNYRSLFTDRTTSYSLINGVRESIYSLDYFGIQANDAMFGGKTNEYYTDLADPYPDVLLPTVRLNGTYTRTPLPAPYATGRFTAMNNVGDAAGQVSTSGPSAYVPALWQAGNLSLINLPASYTPIAMNNAGQVLLQDLGLNGKASVWFNGAATAINGNGKRVISTAMNSSGTVVGCTQNVVSTPKRTDNTAFIWQNGVLQDLTQVLKSKGVSIPSGRRLGCPVAINDSGSILAYHYSTTSTNSITWVRFTARP